MSDHGNDARLSLIMQKALNLVFAVGLGGPLAGGFRKDLDGVAIHCLPGSEIRPTADRLRESLFNILVHASGDGHVRSQ